MEGICISCLFKSRGPAIAFHQLHLQEILYVIIHSGNREGTGTGSVSRSLRTHVPVGMNSAQGSSPVRKLMAPVKALTA